MIDATRSGSLGEPTRPQAERGRAIAPEVVAAVLSVVVIAVIGGGVLAAGSPPPAASAALAATPAPTGLQPSTPAIDVAAIDILLEIDGRLDADRASLATEIGSNPIDASRIAAILRSVNADLIVAEDAAGRLEALPASAVVARRLRTFYAALQHDVSEALGNSVNNPPVYKAAAIATRDALADLHSLDALLVNLRAGPATSAVAPSASPEPSPRPSATPPPTVGPSIVGPSVAPSGGASPGPNVIVNPGFETGVGPPWELVVAATGVATLSPDSTVHETGASAARVDLADPGAERAAVAVRQGQVAIAAGGHYVASIWVRAAAPREVRLRIASAAGDTYATRLFTIGMDWQLLTIDSTVFATDANAYLEIDLGRFAVTTWLDDASFTQVPPTAG